MLFTKLNSILGTPLFTKQNAKIHSDLFRKGYDSVRDLSTGVRKLSNFANSISSSISTLYPALGGLTRQVGGISGLINESLDSVYKNAKRIKNNVEKGKPLEKPKVEENLIDFFD
jgi:hypothetical protein